MCPVYDEQSHRGWRKAKLVTGREDSNVSCPLNFPKSISQPSSMSIMSDGSMFNIVYQRKKKHSINNVVQNKQDLKRSSDCVSVLKRSGDCVSVLSSVDPIVAAKEQNEVIQSKLGSEIVGRKVDPLLVYDRNTLRAKTINMCSHTGGHGSGGNDSNSKQKNIEVDSVNDSCSSSKSNMEPMITSMKPEVDEAGESSSSSVTILEDTMEDPSGKDLCMFILRTQGLLGDLSRNSRVSGEENGTSSGNICSRSCKTCGRSEYVLNMIICDHCEEAFHVSCCNPRMKKVPTDEWFCHSCLKKKHKILKETVDKNSAIIIHELGKSRKGLSKGEANPISLMLKDNGPYTTDVRIGKGFQAEVPIWSGPHPRNTDIDMVGEPIELNFSASPREETSEKLSISGSMSNWLQCQEVVNEGEGVNGTICGKWRRAPLYEVQTDEWECFCCVLWDPVHADCAVPQEMETHEVLKQLKNSDMLRRRTRNQNRGSCKIQDLTRDTTAG